MSLKVRPIAASDVPQACALLNRIIRIGGTTAFEVEVSEEAFAAMYVTGEDLIACHVVLDPAGQVAGFQWIGRNPKLAGECADIATFARGEAPVRGAGRAMFAATRAFAKQAGYSWINATIRADNVAGLGYYAKMGFVDHVLARAVPLRDGTPVDRLSKRLKL
jgi:L-amino acid N-acyltransferase YncA